MMFRRNDNSNLNVEGLEAEKLLREPGVFVLDVRTAQEFQGGALPGATLIPIDELARRLDELPSKKDQSILVYCAHGVRSLHAQDILERHGYSHVHNLRGGLAHFIHYLNSKNS